MDKDEGKEEKRRSEWIKKQNEKSEERKEEMEEWRQGLSGRKMKRRMSEKR